MRIAERNIWHIPFFSILMVLSGHFLGCEPEDVSFSVDCNECYGYQPDSANLIIYLTINAENSAIPITVYKGSPEQGVVDWRDTAYTDEFYLFSAIDVKYTVEATYRSGDKTILAYDGDRMHLVDAGSDCGTPCYIVKGGIFDNRLME